jgi:hypothetical protein
MTPAATVAHLSERMAHARGGVDRRYLHAQRWLRARDAYLAAGEVMTNDPHGRARSAELAEAAGCRAKAWCCLAEGEPAQARRWHREASRRLPVVRAVAR